MQRDQDGHEVDAESKRSVCGEAVPLNGIDEQAARRAHMREMTTARQMAERRRIQPMPGADQLTKLAASHERAAALRAELARIEEEHQSWLGTRGETEAGDRPLRWVNGRLTSAENA